MYFEPPQVGHSCTVTLVSLKEVRRDPELRMPPRLPPPKELPPELVRVRSVVVFVTRKPPLQSYSVQGMRPCPLHFRQASMPVQLHLLQGFP